MPQKSKSALTVQTDTIRMSRLHYFYVAIFAVQTLLYDAWGVTASEATYRRWLAVALFATAVTVVWYLAHVRRESAYYQKLLFVLILSDIALASYAVYSQRGMASKAVFLYVIPLLVAAVLRRGTALMATAALCIAAYVSTAISYFALNFNEGYKIELYGELIFYSALFILVAAILTGLVRNPQNN